MTTTPSPDAGQALTDEQIDVMVDAWFSAETVTKESDIDAAFRSRMRAALAAAPAPTSVQWVPMVGKCQQCGHEHEVAAPAPTAEAVAMSARIQSLIATHGTLRGVSRELGIDVGYLSRLERGEKSEPSDEILAKLGLRRVTVFINSAASSSPAEPVAWLIKTAMNAAYNAGVADESLLCKDAARQAGETMRVYEAELLAALDVRAQHAAAPPATVEREACATLCEEIQRRKGEKFFGQVVSDGSAAQCARAIRGRATPSSAAVQAEPVAWQVWWGIGEMRPHWPPLKTKHEAEAVAAEIKSHTEVRPLVLATPPSTSTKGDE